jgi:hypothetical protein
MLAGCNADHLSCRKLVTTLLVILCFGAVEEHVFSFSKGSALVDFQGHAQTLADDIREKRLEEQSPTIDWSDILRCHLSSY